MNKQIRQNNDLRDPPQASGDHPVPACLLSFESGYPDAPTRHARAIPDHRHFISHGDTGRPFGQGDESEE